MGILAAPAGLGDGLFKGLEIGGKAGIGGDLEFILEVIALGVGGRKSDRGEELDIGGAVGRGRNGRSSWRLVADVVNNGGGEATGDAGVGRGKNGPVLEVAGEGGGEGSGAVGADTGSGIKTVRSIVGDVTPRATEIIEPDGGALGTVGGAQGQTDDGVALGGKRAGEVKVFSLPLENLGGGRIAAGREGRGGDEGDGAVSRGGVGDGGDDGLADGFATVDIFLKDNSIADGEGVGEISSAGGIIDRHTCARRIGRLRRSDKVDGDGMSAAAIFVGLADLICGAGNVAYSDFID